MRLYASRNAGCGIDDLFLDCMHDKIRNNGSVRTRAVYNILGDELEALKVLICIYLPETERVKFWLSVPTELKR